MSKGLILDFDDTLVDFDYWQRHKWMIVNKWIENQLGLKHFDHTFWKVYDQHSQYYHHRVRDTLIHLGYSPTAVLNLMDTINEYADQESFEDRVFSGARKFLRNCRDTGWKLALLTAGCESPQKQRVCASKLETYFDVIQFGCDEFRKPSIGAFKTCIKEIGTEYTVAVGDDQRDLFAPYTLGINVVQLDLMGFNRPMFSDRVIRVTTYDELFNLINKEESEHKRGS